jgi:alkyl sulfatase BDS1-like metallo-beta-lactamase superfamily hydrolase
VLELATIAMQEKKYAWACQLVQYLYLLTPNSNPVRMLKADALEAMGRVTPAHTIRSWYLTHAAVLRGQVSVPRLIFPGTKMLALAPPLASVNAYRVRLDPSKAHDSTQSLSLSFANTKQTHGWFLRRGVANFVESNEEALAADTVLEVSSEHWFEFYSCRITMDDFLRQTRVLKGELAAAKTFFACFDDLA